MSKLDLTDKESSWFDSLLNAFSPSFRSVVSKGFSNTTWFFQKGVEKIENLGWIASTGSLVFILPAGIAIATEQQNKNKLEK
ncbi:import receptor subunit tom22 [Anaeramoeba ignava]|uniref:Import receptor subunit tom22 n=1 Tax=Anaeramoeba ignava TaxID=1746090 RepID=A0A9Q0RFN7_ANAIG|nr:import receptor subunit tom22 [Anaeramoeba ignava]